MHVISYLTPTFEQRESSFERYVEQGDISSPASNPSQLDIKSINHFSACDECSPTGEGAYENWWTPGTHIQILSENDLCLYLSVDC